MKKASRISTIEKIGFSLGDLAANLVFQTLIAFLAYFYTDIYGISGEDASKIILVVGLIAAFAFNPLIGALADRTRTKWGKFRPWILFTSVPLGIVAVLAFSTPDFGYKGKLIYAVVTYSLLLLLYAANNLPYSALSGVITGDMQERNSISSYRFVAVMVAQFFVQVFMLPLVLSVGNGDKAAGMETVITYLAIIGTVMLIITFFTTKERVVPTEEQKSSLSSDLKDLVSNLPWWIMLTMTILIFITLAMKGGSYVYFFNEYIDLAALENFLKPVLNLKLLQNLFLPESVRETVQTLRMDGVTDIMASLSIDDKNDYIRSLGFGLFNAGGAILGIIGIMLSKRFADKYGKKVVFGTALFISTLFICVFAVYSPTSISAMYLSMIAHGFFYGITTPILWAMIADVADYSEWKNNRRATAIIFSAMLMGLKIGLSIGGAMVAAIMGHYGYISKSNMDAGTEIVQPESVAIGAKMLISVFPSIPFFISCALLFFYSINKSMEIKIEKELEERRLSL